MLRRARPSFAVMRLLVFVVIVLGTSCTLSPSMDRAALDSLWDEHMLKGASINWNDGREIPSIAQHHSPNHEAILI